VTGSMHFPRCRQSASLLPDGRVLVVGGDGGNGPQWWSTAEIYDPSTGSWSEIARMNSPRTLGVLLALHNGTYLAPAGAAQGTIPRDSADVYDPSTGSWTATPSLNQSRYAFAGVVLADGRALVEGGTTQDDQPTSTCELYDPTADVWTLTGSIQERSANLVLLDGGEVLATDGPTIPSSELFDPASGSWSPTTGEMHFVRVGDSATLLDDGRVLVAGGEGPNSLIVQSELYVPRTEQWLLGPSLHTARWVQSAVRLADGRVLVAGGLDAQFQPIASAEIYTP